MDARPQRPLRSLHVQGDENIAPSKQALHQRHKSTGTLSSMLGAGGLKMAAKRTAFGDVSNVAKTVTAQDDLVAIGKNNAYEAVHKTVQVPEKAAALLRPAQRPAAAAGLKSILAKTSAVTSSTTSVPVNKAQHALDVAQQQTTQNNKLRALPKRATVTTIYKDSTEPGAEQAQPHHALVEGDTAPPAPIHQSLVPRQYKSQPQLKADALISRPPESKYNNTMPEEQKDVMLPPLATTGDRSPDQEVIDTGFADYGSYASLLEQDREYREAENVAVRLREEDRLERQLPPLPPVSEPEEYWEEEEEDELYDEQGYTTAHSYRSRGDNTTGGATTVLFPKVTNKVKKEIALAKDLVESARTQDEIEDEAWDTSMVAEYGDEIFSYMRELENKMLPNAHYMDNQAEIQWSMRSVLMDWLVQVHHRFSLLPETLFLCVNYIDRFLSCKIVSLGKLQLVGATAIFVAAKYEEINCPSVSEIVYMVDGGYTVDEILKAERFMLSMLQFELGWPGPMSFLRRISKADDYDLETRTLAKYFLEVTIMDERFVGSPPSFVAAGAHCLARLMLKKGDWSHAHVCYSDYTWTQLKPLVSMIMECCQNPQKHHSAVYEKYSDRRYKCASVFVKTEMERGFTLPTTQRSSARPSLPTLEDVAAHMSFEAQDSYTRMVQIKG
ncbi:MAG: hypothetical protein M1818_001202 [Claussenomyces sp. TS43310]|nr:MAG: hypothetical protein M1818_001202 [Claussenomyces sp. TS43310]